MTGNSWQPISTAPLEQDLELAVLDASGVHALVARCRRSAHGWINAATGKQIDVSPTHWRAWQDTTSGGRS